MQSLLRFIVPVTREEHSRIQYFGEPVSVTTLHLLHPGLVPLFDILVANRPVFLAIAANAQDRVEHVALADKERGDVHVVVLELGQHGCLVIGVVGQDFQTEKSGSGAAALVPSRGVDLGVALAVEGDGLVGEVKAVRRWGSRK